jgi:NADH-quinone oxidoreductase subunit C
MESLEQIKTLIETAVPEAKIEVVTNGSPSAQHSLLVSRDQARAVAEFLKTTLALRFDYVSNVTGIDWPELVVKETLRSRRVIDGVERDIEEVVEKVRPGFLEVVYHLYSMELKHGPLILRLRTENRTDQIQVPSLTPVWRGAEFQEREVFDLYGVVFEGHPDLRRILMWDGFQDHPMRKDYVAPDDYEYEPTPHDEVLERAKAQAARDQPSSNHQPVAPG